MRLSHAFPHAPPADEGLLAHSAGCHVGPPATGGRAALGERLRRPWGAGGVRPWAHHSTSLVSDEEERTEPSWPVLLTKYYKHKAGLAGQREMKASVRKSMEERAVERAEHKSETHGLEAKASRQQDKATDREAATTPGEQLARAEERIANTAAKEKAVDKEANEVQKMLRHDDQRDKEALEQLKENTEEQEAMKGLHDAEQEMELRTRRLRNQVPGEVAVNRFGLEITRQDDCEAEMNTVYTPAGRCVVATETRGPETPEETSIAAVAKENRGRWEAALERLHKAKHAHAEVKDRAKDVQRTVNELLQRKPKAAPSKVKRAQEEAAKVSEEEKAAAKAEDAAKSDESAARNLYVDHLNKILKVQQEQKRVHEKEAGAAQAELKKADQKLEESEDQMARLEEEVSKVLEDKSTSLRSQAAQQEGDQRRDLEQEAAYYQQWKQEADQEAEALKKHDQAEVFDRHSKQRELAEKAEEAHRITLGNAASRGQGDETLEAKAGDKMPDKLAVLHQKWAKKSENAEQAGDDKSVEVDKLSDALQERHKVALRSAKTQEELLRVSRLAPSSAGPGLALLWAPAWPVARAEPRISLPIPRRRRVRYNGGRFL